VPDDRTPDEQESPADGTPATPEPARPAASANYFDRKQAKRRTLRQTARRTPRHPRRAADRYRAYQQQATAPSAPNTAPGTEPPQPEGPLASAFAMAEREQLQTRNRRQGRFRRMTRKKWFWPLVGVPGTLLIIALLVLSPVIYQAFFAYRDVQVDPVDHISSAYVPQLNTEGTPELVAAPTEMTNQDWTGTERITILLLGVDKSENGASRTDTLILVNIDPVAKTANMLAIPRDLKVVIPGYGVDKINAAFALGEFNKVQGGGAGLTIRTIEANLGIPISNFVQIDFDGFVRMVDTVGGITVDVPYPIKDDEYPAEDYNYQRIYFPAGWQHLDGETALQYARTRHQDGDSRRSARQQQVLMALRDQAVGLDLIPQLPTLIGQFGDSVRTDIAINDAVKLARLGTSIPRDQITQTSLMPALYEEQAWEGPYFLTADWEAVGGVLSEFAGAEISPPGAALANPDYGLPILIENGTSNEGLAGRIGTVLEQNGFWNVEVALTENPGSQEDTEIVDNEGNLGTSALITNLIGVGADRIAIGNLPSTETSGPGDGTQGNSAPVANSQYAIVITLGTDAPDPAGSEWDLTDYQQQVGDDGGGEMSTPTPESDSTGDGTGDGEETVPEEDTGT
jgi:polyisoprenyl-teichoic acid--peptidoglycan teichoic acid transferase